MATPNVCRGDMNYCRRLNIYTAAGDMFVLINNSLLDVLLSREFIARSVYLKAVNVSETDTTINRNIELPTRISATRFSRIIFDNAGNLSN